MDTIIYIYHDKKMDTGYRRQDFDMGDYHLVRVGVSRELLDILQEKESDERADCESICKESAGENLFRQMREEGEQERHFFPWWHRRRKKQARRNRESARRKQQERRDAEKSGQQRLQQEVKCRQEFVQEIMEDRNHSYFVTEEPVPFLEGWIFRGYLEEEWVMHMMEYVKWNRVADSYHVAIPHHFLILGKSQCIPRLLLQYVKGMKSLKWVMLKRQFGDAEEALVEEIYEEYGLAIEVRLLTEDREFRSIGLACMVPTVIVDFGEEERIPTADIAPGSIWLDMSASEVKRCRLENRNTGIAYFSLKKEWKQPQNALYQLDTNNKNRYNT